MRFPRLRRWLRRLAIGFSAMVVLGAVALLIYQIVVGQRWNRFERELDQVNASMPYFAPGRMPLLEPHIPGNAWDGYFAVLHQMPTQDSRDRAALSAVSSGKAKSGDAEAARACVERLQPALDALREAARCGMADPRAGLPPGMDRRRFREACSVLRTVAQLDVRYRFESGEQAEAVLRVAVMAQFALDLCRFPVPFSCFYGRDFLYWQLIEIAERVTGPGTATAVLDAVARLCGAIDLSLPTSAEFWDLMHVPECAVIREVPRDPDAWRRAHEVRGRSDYDPFRERLRFLPRALSIRESAVEYWDACRGLRSALEGAEARPHAEVCAELLRDHGAHYTLWQMLLHGGFFTYGVTYDTRLEVLGRDLRARCRLLRAAAQLRKGLPPENPDWPVDPFTQKPIGYRTVGDRIVIWTDGGNGNKGGIGEWSGGDRLCDIVLVLEPR